MKVVVLNGSPKGKMSVTLQYVEWLRLRFPAHDVSTHEVAQRIRFYEKDPAALDQLLSEIESCDVVLFAFPLYFMHVHGNYKRFIELLDERGAKHAFQGKYAASISTSIHFFDHTAHQYVREIAEDLGMQYAGFFSAHMNDLADTDKQRQLAVFFELLSRAVTAKRTFPGTTPAAGKNDFHYQPKPVSSRTNISGLKIRVITDAGPEDANLNAMIGRFSDSCEPRPEVINLRDIDIKGGCQGCVRCGLDNICAYEGKDGFIPFFRQKIMDADVLIFAGRVHDRFLSSRWKTFMDRSFFQTHQPKFLSAQVGYLISGSVPGLSSMREVLTAYAELEGRHLLGIITDEIGDKIGNDAHTRLDSAITSLAFLATDCARREYAPPKTFRQVAGRKLFRDDVYGELRFSFAADHRYYVRHGWYDFPTRKLGTIALMNSLRFLAWLIPPFKRAYQRMTVQGMLMHNARAVKSAGGGMK